MPLSHRLLARLHHEGPVVTGFAGAPLFQGSLSNELPAAASDPRAHFINGDQDCAVLGNRLSEMEEESLVEDDDCSSGPGAGFLVLLFVVIAGDIYSCIHIYGRERARGKMRGYRTP